MALYEFFCNACQDRFEQITSSTDPDQGKCPKCHSKKDTQKLISAFRVAGRGDLRESTMHGCHEAHVSLQDGPKKGGGCGSGGCSHSH